MKFSRTPPRAPSRAPTLGADNDLVRREILDYSPERMAELAAAGALG